MEVPGRVRVIWVCVFGRISEWHEGSLGKSMSDVKRGSQSDMESWEEMKGFLVKGISRKMCALYEGKERTWLLFLCPVNHDGYIGALLKKTWVIISNKECWGKECKWYGGSLTIRQQLGQKWLYTYTWIYYILHINENLHAHSSSFFLSSFWHSCTQWQPYCVHYCSTAIIGVSRW